MALIFRQLMDKVSFTYSYIIGDTNTKEVAIVDSVHENIEIYVSLLRTQNWNLKYLIETHLHADHITAIAQLKKIYPASEALISHRADVKYNVTKVRENEIKHIGEILLHFFETPGHTPESISILVDNNRLLTGDCMFIGSCGRTDFQQGSNKDMYSSLQKLALLPDDTLVYPAHDYKNRFVSTIQEEKITNKQLNHANYAEFEKDLNSWNLPEPKRIKESVPANILGGKE